MGTEGLAEIAESSTRAWMGVPLYNRNQSITGILVVSSTLAVSYSDSDLSLLTTLGRCLSVALENAQLVDTEQERRRIVNTLIDVSHDVGSSLQIEEVLARVQDHIERVVAYDRVAIMLAMPDSSLVFSATKGYDPALRGRKLQLGPDDLLKRVLESRLPMVLGATPDTMTLLSVRDTQEIWPRGFGCMLVPLVIGDRSIGIISLCKSDQKAYTQQDASAAFAVARQAAVAIHNAQTHAQSQAAMEVLQQRNLRLAAIHQISTMVNSTLDRDEILHLAAQALADIFKTDHCGVVLMNAAQPDIQLVAEWPQMGAQGLRLLVKQPVI